MDRDVFAQRVQEMTKSLYYVTCAILPAIADREDALQNGIVRGLTRCDTLRDEDKLKQWLTRIVINECYTLLRKKKREIPTEELPTASFDEGFADSSLHDAVMGLSEKRRLVLTLHLDGYTMREIAKILRIPEGTVKTRLRDARLALRDIIESEKEVLA